VIKGNQANKMPIDKTFPAQSKAQDHPAIHLPRLQKKKGSRIVGCFDKNIPKSLDTLLYPKTGAGFCLSTHIIKWMA